MTTLSRCDDCYAQVEPMDWYGHRCWHQDQEAALDDLQASIEDIAIKTIVQGVIEDSDLFPRLEKIEGLAAIFSAFAEKQLDKT